LAAQMESAGKLGEEVEFSLTSEEKHACNSDEERCGSADHARCGSRQSLSGQRRCIPSPVVSVLKRTPSKPKEVLHIDVETLNPTRAKQRPSQLIRFEHCSQMPQTTQPPPPPQASWQPPPGQTARMPVSCAQPLQPTPQVTPAAAMQFDSMAQQRQQQQQRHQHHQRHPSPFPKTGQNRRGLCAGYSSAPHRCQHSRIPQDQRAPSPSTARAAAVPRLTLPPVGFAATSSIPNLATSTLGVEEGHSEPIQRQRQQEQTQWQQAQFSSV